MKNSLYQDKARLAQLFFDTLNSCARDIPNLVSPHLGDRIGPMGTSSTKKHSRPKPAANELAALPLGGRIKLDPWSDQVQMLKLKPASQTEDMPFQITPVLFYLTRQHDTSMIQPNDGVAAKLNSAAKSQ
jgi:hypothetical protein